MGELDFENILGEDEIETLFMDPDDSTSGEPEVSEGGEISTQADAADLQEKNNETDETTEAVNPEDLFDEADSQPESVGSGKKEKEQGDTATVEDDGTSPQNFYSSIANALAVDGIFPNLDEERVKSVDSAEGLSDLIEAEVNARYEEGQQRVLNALKNGVEASDIRKYENTLSFISSLKESDISEESEKGEQLRRNLIYQDFLNKGMSPEKAQKLTERSMDAGNDVEDAKEALQSNREYFQNAYNQLLKEAQDRADAEKEATRKDAEQLKASIMKDKDLLGDMELSADLRRKTFEFISKPMYKDPDTGEYLTALQKYEREHHSDFLKYVGLFMTLTNGFKDFESFAKGKVKKEVKKGLKALEQTLNTTRRSTDGSLRMVTGVREDPESFINKGLQLDI